MSLIECKNIALSYENITVLSDLSFHVEQGDYLCVVGENGSGKSTLMKALLSLKHVSGGEIIFGDGLKRNEIGYLPQQTVVRRDFPASVREVVFSGCLNRSHVGPFYGAAEKKRAFANMDRLGIRGLEKRPFCELSGGQQQRVLIARALCATEKLLLLDEPATGLDPVVTADLYSITDELNKEGLTVVMVSHDIRSAVRYAGKILHIKSDSAFFGTTEEYLRSSIGKSFTGTLAK